MNLPNFDLDLANRQLNNRTACQRLEWALDFFDRILISSSFGLQTSVIIDIVYGRMEKRIPVVFLDTLYHFPETLILAGRFLERYDLNLQIIRPPDAVNRTQFEEKYGHKLWDRNVDQFHELTKLRQIRDVLKFRDAWITGIRREQSNTRRSAQIVEFDAKHNLFKVNPLVDWSRRQVLEYIRANDVPYNSLFEQGYQSIGDEPLTQPVTDGQHERSGRWIGTEKTECGLHV
ncbi:MAG: phosphoadenylyl-sulfate reductase [Candidatus Marinimicrobia bacterium]|nr:phosphoadenylyl-sulfate reductase [Candidatus Neomarinimicrobiota bacterium]